VKLYRLPLAPHLRCYFPFYARCMLYTPAREMGNKIPSYVTLEILSSVMDSCVLVSNILKGGEFWPFRLKLSSQTLNLKWITSPS